MVLTRREPRGLLNVRNEIDRIFDRLWDRGDRDFWPAETSWYPTADVAEHTDAYTVTVDLPGVDRKNVHVNVQDNVLTITGERVSEHKQEEGMYRHVERMSGSFSRSFTLPSSVDDGNVKAAFKDGVLTVTLPKSEEAKPKQIEIT